MKPQLETDRTVLAWHAGGSLLCVLLLSAGWWWGLSPLMNDSREQHAVVEQAAFAEQRAQRIKAECDTLAADLQHVRQLIEQQPITLETTSEINPLLAKLASWFETHGLTMTQTQADQPVLLSYYDYIPIRLAGEGSFTDLLALLSRLHEERKDLGVISFSIRRLSRHGSIAFGLELAWYVMAAPQAGGAQPTASVPTN